MASINISMSTKALCLASHAFAGKYDRTGREPAVCHSLRVEAGVRKHDEITRVIALLHDTVEDTAVTAADIANEFAEFGEDAAAEIVAGVLSVTRGYTERSTGNMVFSPPPADTVCDCPHRKCVNNLHRYDKELYRDFVARSKANPRGRHVKIADISDNCSPARIEGLSEDEKGIVDERYAPALAFLLDPDPNAAYLTAKQIERIRLQEQAAAGREAETDMRAEADRKWEEGR